MFALHMFVLVVAIGVVWYMTSPVVSGAVDSIPRIVGDTPNVVMRVISNLKEGYAVLGVAVLFVLAILVLLVKLVS